IVDRQEPRPGEGDRRRIGDAEVEATDIARVDRGAPDERQRHVYGAPRLAAHGLELARRRTAIASDGVSVVALLVRAVSRLLDDAVAAPGERTLVGAIGVVRDGSRRAWLASRVALLHARLDPAVTARSLLALVRAGTRRAVRGAVVTGFTRIHDAVAAELPLLLRFDAIRRHGELVARLGGARDDTGRERVAAPDVGSGEARTRRHDGPRQTCRMLRGHQADRRDQPEARRRSVDRPLAANGLRQDLIDDRRAYPADGTNAATLRPRYLPLPARHGRPLQGRGAAVEQLLHLRPNEVDGRSTVLSRRVVHQDT